MPAKNMQRLGKSDEIARYEPGPLMDQLIKRVLTVCARLAPVNRTGIAGDRFALQRDVLPVALHRQLLEICRKPLQVPLVGQNGNRLCAEKVVIPKSEQAHEHRQVGFERSCAECSSIW